MFVYDCGIQSLLVPFTVLRLPRMRAALRCFVSATRLFDLIDMVEKCGGGQRVQSVSAGFTIRTSPVALL